MRHKPHRMVLPATPADVARVRYAPSEALEARVNSEVVGHRFSKLTALSVIGTGRTRRVLCVCDCGKEVSILLHRVRTGRSRSCGCERDRLTAERNTTHGATKGCGHGVKPPNEWVIWINMIYRCTDPKNHAYSSYGGRGITVIDRWRGEQGYANFLADMGPRPSKRHSIDRIDNNGNYEPGNCRWATARQQCRNTRVNHIVEYQGQRMCLVELAEKVGINDGTLLSRLKLGWSVVEAVELPVAKTSRWPSRTVQ